jgi:hypothetical protein
MPAEALVQDTHPALSEAAIQCIEYLRAQPGGNIEIMHPSGAILNAYTYEEMAQAIEAQTADGIQHVREFIDRQKTTMDRFLDSKAVRFVTESGPYRDFKRFLSELGEI